MFRNHEISEKKIAFIFVCLHKWYRQNIQSKPLLKRQHGWTQVRSKFNSLFCLRVRFRKTIWQNKS